MIPETKLIYLVRDPIERIVAHWAQTREDGDRTSLEEALADYERPDHPLVCASKYATQIEQYLDYFSPDQLLVLDMDELRANRLGNDRGDVPLPRGRRPLSLPRVRGPAQRPSRQAGDDRAPGRSSGIGCWLPAGRAVPAGVRRRAAPPLRRLLSRKVRTPPLRREDRIRPAGAAAAGGRAVAEPHREGVRIVVDVSAARVRASFREGFGFAAISAAVGGVSGSRPHPVARLYGIEVIGQYALATAPMGIVWFFSTVQERPGLIRALNPLPAARSRDHRHLRRRPRLLGRAHRPGRRRSAPGSPTCSSTARSTNRSCSLPPWPALAAT